MIPSKTLPPGEVGEIRIRGPNVTKGYWNRPAETADAFVGDRFLTGDIGYMDADGYFFLVDRKKDMIISGGFNVYPQMIEQAIYAHPAVHEVIVIGIPDDYRGEAAKAFVKLRAGAAPFPLDELKTFLAGKLGKHEIPAALEFVDDLPRTSVGKLSRHELRTGSRRRSAAARVRRPGMSAVQQAPLHLSHRERSDRVAIRVRGYGPPIDRTPSPQPSPTEVGFIRLRRIKMSNSGKTELRERGRIEFADAFPIRF